MAAQQQNSSATAGVSSAHAIGSAALWLSLLTFGAFFLNVLVGGPLRMKPWISDVGEMLTLGLAVILFVAGTIAREYEANQKEAEAEGGVTPAQDSNRV